ncbi:glycosyltransferase family 9 protein [Flavihumibacter stibioxidans]|uniref:Glycosyltransferase family 9 protein n=1 Tax=Flavihumibacter stibioxidans TaxID=1834163 RepID=A0ABR7M447_9BACT|nr:glycosyltransferase family 9 protein [Flavihumibacter stibioxidans]MBC6489426.1 hypothetical protein [Flavihumibacter stibioxidans]
MPEKEQVLIIKTSAIGDVVRTTAVLNAFPDAVITWLTNENCFPLFEADNGGNINIQNINAVPGSVLTGNYNLVLSLEEDKCCAELAGTIRTKKFTGVYWDGSLNYTEDAAPWFDMSLISKYGKEYANRLKMANQKTYQEFLFGMIGKPFTGQPYKIFQPPAERNINRIGIESAAGNRWPNKRWAGYKNLADMLAASGFEIMFFERKDHLRQYMAEIASCGIIVSGDTLAMHLALGFRLPVVSIFNCTSPAEIYDYNLLRKIVNPRLNDFFYATTSNPDLISLIPADQVFQEVIKSWQHWYRYAPQTKDTASS